MIKMKALLTAAMISMSSLAAAEMMQPLYNPIYNAPAGYEWGCDYFAFYAYPYGGFTNYGRLKNGESTTVYSGGNMIPVYCWNGTLQPYGEAYWGELLPGQY